MILCLSAYIFAESTVSALKYKLFNYFLVCSFLYLGLKIIQYDIKKPIDYAIKLVIYNDRGN